jgi:hypothetical protein
MKCRLAGETEALGENLPHRHFCPSQNPTWPDPGLKPGRRGGKPATNHLRYGPALYAIYIINIFIISKQRLQQILNLIKFACSIIVYGKYVLLFSYQLKFNKIFLSRFSSSGTGLLRLTLQFDQVTILRHSNMKLNKYITIQLRTR